VSNQSVSSYNRIVDTPAIVRLLLWINISGCSVIGVVFWAARGWQETTLSLLMMGAVSGLLLILERIGHPQFAGFLLYLLVSIVITFNVSIGHGIYDEAMVVYPLMIVFSGLLFGKGSSVLVTGISLGQICLIYIFAQAGIVQPFEGAVQLNLEDTITTIIIILVTGYIVWLVIDIIEKAVVRILESERNLEEAYTQTLIAWAKTLELRRREEPGHSARVSSLSCLFAEHVGLKSDQIKIIRQGSLLHDIGKMGIPESILLKSEAHDPEEKTLMRTHTRLGEGLVQDIEYLEGAREIIACHHERYDGKGYPDRLQGDEIPYSAQLFSVVDCWDSLRSDRPCRKAWTDEKTLKHIRNQSGKKFNPGVVQQFIDMVDKFGLVEEK
jgi:putative nucleotidyltransferase with HDIG domain